MTPSRTNAPRTLIIGLDGATFDVIDPLVRGGFLPTFERVMRGGARAALSAFPDMNSAAAWSSLVTGYNAGEHGIFHFDPNWHRLSQRGIKTRPALGADRRRDPFWRVLSRAGKRVGVINVPLSYPADTLNGFMLAGMDTPGVHSKGFSFPPLLYEELRAQGIAYEIDTLNLARLAERDPYRLPAQIQRMTDARGRAMLYLASAKEWDVMMGVFVAPDRVQHFFWHDEDAGADSPSWRPLRELYQQLDGFLARVLSEMDAKTSLLIVSDHGFGRKRGALHSLNEVFARWGLLRDSEHTRDPQGALLAKALAYGRRFLPSSLQYPLARLFPQAHLRALTAGGFSKIDWGGTKLFADPDGWGVYINLQGREPEGVVPPDEYETLRQHARARLLELRDGETNRPLLRAVHEREALFHGPFLERAPDLMLEWDFEAVGDAVTYEDDGGRVVVGQIRHSSSDEKWKGTHRPDGVLIAYGAPIRQAHVLSRATLYDVAPTILHLQGQSLPAGMDGRVLSELFTPEFLREHPIRHSELPAPPALDPGVPLDQDLDRVTERLRALGYLDAE